MISNPAPLDKSTVMYALPTIVQQCGNVAPFPPPSLYWTSRDPAVDNLEVHADSPDGPLLASGKSGALHLGEPSNTAYYLTDPSGHTLATEQLTYRPAPRCNAVPNPTGQISASPNPVLSCSDNPYTETQNTLYGTGLGPLAIRVLSLNGPALTGDVFANYVVAQTGDWVTDGMPFFLTSSFPWAAATEKVFLLPIRSCLPSAAPPGPAIQAKPRVVDGCTSDQTVTLAWSSAGRQPVEIREASPTGRLLGRLNQSAGLLEVAPKTTTTYYLLTYREGDRSEAAVDSVTVKDCGRNS